MGNTIFVNIPPNSLGTFQRTRLHDDIAVSITLRRSRDGVALTDGTAFFTYIKGNGIGTARRSGIQIVVHGYEEVAGTHDGTASTCHIVVIGTGTEVRSFCRVGDALGNAFVLTPTANRQVLTLRTEGGGLVAVAGDAQFGGDAFRQLTGQLGTLLQRNTTDGYQRQHIGSSDTRMGTMVLPHVYHLACYLDGTEGCLADGLRFTDKGDDGTVGGLTWVNVEQEHAFYAFYGIGYLFDDTWISSLTEVGDTFY